MVKQPFVLKVQRVYPIYKQIYKIKESLKSDSKIQFTLTSLKMKINTIKTNEPHFNSKTDIENYDKSYNDLFHILISLENSENRSNILTQFFLEFKLYSLNLNFHLINFLIKVSECLKEFKKLNSDIINPEIFNIWNNFDFTEFKIIEYGNSIFYTDRTLKEFDEKLIQYCEKIKGYDFNLDFNILLSPLYNFLIKNESIPDEFKFQNDMKSLRTQIVSIFNLLVLFKKMRNHFIEFNKHITEYSEFYFILTTISSEYKREIKRKNPKNTNIDKDRKRIKEIQKLYLSNIESINNYCGYQSLKKYFNYLNNYIPKLETLEKLLEQLNQLLKLKTQYKLDEYIVLETETETDIFTTEAIETNELKKIDDELGKLQLSK